jgi:uncharacterized membrane protein
VQGYLLGAAELGLLAAGFWGVGDFAGGMAAKSAGGSLHATLKIIIVAHLTSFMLLAGLAAMRHDPLLHGAALAWALVAGVAAALSVSAFYVALASGAMGVSAALSGLLAAALPAIVSGATDGLPGWRRFTGFVIAGAAIWLIAAGSAAREQGRTTVLALLSGTGFGFYFVALRFAGRGGLLWPVATSRLTSVVTCAVILLVLKLAQAKSAPGQSLIWGRRLFAWVVATTIFDTAGNLFFLAATRAGRLDIAAVLASLYPASTIVMAAIVLKERLTGRQTIGMAVALAAVVLIAL